MTRTGGAPGADGRGVAGALGLGWLMVSTSAVVIVLAAPVPPLVVAAGRVAVTALLWCAIAALRSAPAPLHASGHVPHGRIVLSGVLLGAHFAAWIASLSLTSVAHGAVLVALQPLFAGLFGLMLGDRPPLVRLALGVAVAGGGTLLMATAGEATEGTSFVGDALAVLGGALSALYLTINLGIGGALPL
ncbi:MAG: DMT family transporter, partial [Planctomycetota bacterium]